MHYCLSYMGTAYSLSVALLTPIIYKMPLKHVAKQWVTEALGTVEHNQNETKSNTTPRNCPWVKFL